MRKRKELSACCGKKGKLNMVRKPTEPLYFCTECGKPCEVALEEVKVSRLSAKRKATGEMDVFLDLYVKHDGLSAVSGLPLEYPPGHERFHCQFSHILPKGSYRRYQTLPENIVPCLYAEHRQWEEERNREKLAAINPKWIPYIKLEQELKRRYHEEANNA